MAQRSKIGTALGQGCDGGFRGVREWLAPAAVAGILLCPYLTLWLTFDFSLMAQASVIVILLLASATTARQGVGEWWKALRWEFRWALGLYATGALWGAAVGLASANPPWFLAAQSYAMLIFPVSIAVFGVCRIRAEALASSLAVAACLALLLHLMVAAFFPALVTEVHGGSLRFLVRHGVSYAGPALISGLICGFWWWSSRGVLAAAGFLASAVLMVGTMSRGSLIAAGAGAAFVALLGVGRGIRRAGLFATISAILLAAMVIVTSWDRLSAGPTKEGRRVTFIVGEAKGKLRERSIGVAWLETELFPVVGYALEVRAEVVGPLGERVYLWVEPFSADGDLLVQHRGSLVSERMQEKLRGVVVLPSETASVRLRISAREAIWRVEGLEYRSIRSPTVAHVRALGGLRMLTREQEGTPPSATEEWVRSLVDRMSRARRAVNEPGNDPRIAYRLEETRVAYETWQHGSLGRKLAGLGLGATFPIQASGWRGAHDASEAPVVVEGQHGTSYLHNVYLFLLTKLGLAGALVLVALLLIAGGLARLAWVGVPGRGRWILSAAAAVWIGLLVWGVSSPEIISFRLAPVLGALVAVAAGIGPALSSEDSGDLLRERPRLEPVGLAAEGG
jgi:hypothetical protein